MMIDRLAGNAALKDSVRLMLESRRLTHSVLLVGETGLGAGYAARCVAADYLYPAGGAPAEALLRGECCRAVGKAGDRDSGRIETGVVREAISVTGMGSGGRYLVSQVKAMRTEIFNTSLSAEGRAVLLYHVERMNEESANALLKVMEEPPEGVLFLLTADSLAGVLPTIRSRCVSFAVAPVSPEECARWCIGQGVDKKQARLYSELFDGHIGTVLAAARDDARREQVEKALTLAKAAAAQDSYAAAVLLAGYEKDRAESRSEGTRDPLLFAPGARALTPDQQDGMGEKTAAVAEELVFSSSMPTSWKNGALPRMSSRKKITDYFGITVEALMDTKKSPPGWASSTNRCRKLWSCLTAQRQSSATRWKRCCAPGQSRSESADKRQICFGRGFGQDGQNLGDQIRVLPQEISSFVIMPKTLFCCIYNFMLQQL